MTDHTKGKGDVRQCAIVAQKGALTSNHSVKHVALTPPFDREVSIGSAFLDTLHGPKSWYAGWT